MIIVKLKNYLKKVFSDEKLTFLRKQKSIAGFLFQNNLSNLAVIYGSDKYGKHSYTAHYKNHLTKFRNRKIKILEIGVGGNESKTHGAASLKMWKSYFRKAKIYGIDIHDKTALAEKRIHILQGDQSDTVFLNQIGAEYGPFDIIIDDGSHINNHIITSFKALIPYLNDGGVYVVEDLQTSYWESYGGSSTDLNKKGTAMNFFKGLLDCINHSEFQLENYQPTYLDKHISGMHFYHNIVFIDKEDK